MTDATAPATPDEIDWSDQDDQSTGPSYPELPANPHNHRFTISLDSRGPMIVVRGNTAAEINAAFQELETAGTGRIVTAFAAALKGGASAPAPQQAFAQQQYPQPAQQFPGQPGTAPAPWQNAGAPAPQQFAQQPSEYQQAGWQRLKVPFPQKGAFDAITAQYGFRKGRPSEGGQLSWNKDAKAWFVSPDIAGAYAQFNPMPA